VEKQRQEQLRFGFETHPYEPGLLGLSVEAGIKSGDDLPNEFSVGAAALYCDHK